MADIESLHTGAIIKLNREYPVYQSVDGVYDDEIVGFTSESDIAIITFSRWEEDGFYIETKLLNGEHNGYDNLAINESDYEASTLIELEDLVAAYDRLNQQTPPTPYQPLPSAHKGDIERRK